MADFNIGGSGSGSNPSPVSTTGSTSSKRQAYIRGKNGDLIGNNWSVPKGDFSNFMGYKPPSQEELTGKKPISGGRVIELALQKEMAALGEGAAQHGNEYRNIYVAPFRFQNEPGREKDMIASGIDAIQQGPEKSTAAAEVNRMGSLSPAKYMEMLNTYSEKTKNDNVRYMEMQYKFMNISKQEGTISNLMKVRNDAVKGAIRGSNG